MLKLYRGKYTHNELIALATHCYDFCKYTEYKGDYCDGHCKLRNVCNDLARLARYADKLAVELESTNSQNEESAHC